MSSSQNVIYFPYINLPQESWFTTTLLYWDTIYSIVPNEYTQYPIMLEEYTRTLIEEHLVKPIVPMNYIEHIPNFNHQFLSFIDRRDYPVNRKMRDTALPKVKVHIEKLGDLAEELVRRKLAIIDKYPWYYVESYTAHQFMLYLATELGKLKQINGKPITDDLIQYELFQAQQHRDHNLELTISEIRPIILDEILPTPINSVDPRDILNFKDDNKKLLINFRNDIETNLIYLAGFDGTKKEQKISYFIDLKKKQIAELKMVMESYGWKVRLSKIAGYTIATLGIIYTLTKGEPVSVFATASGLIPSIVQDLFQRTQINPNNMAYAVLAHQKF